MSLKKITGNETPRPLRGKTNKFNRAVRFVDLTESLKEIEENFIQLPANPQNGDALVYNSTTGLWEPGSVGGGGIEGTNYVFVQANGTPTENAAELQAAYDEAKTMLPSASNRITVIAASGYYEFPNSSPFVMDTEFIDLVSLTGNADVFLYTTNSEFNTTTRNNILVLADNVFVKGIDASKDVWIFDGDNPLLISGAFNILDDFNNLSCHSCLGGDFSFGVASGNFTNCIGGEKSFSSGGTASGIFNNCVGGGSSFGAGGVASGTFNNCEGGIYSFGGDGGTLSGKLYYCRLNSGTFQTVSLSGKTYYCIDGNGDPNNQ